MYKQIENHIQQLGAPIFKRPFSLNVVAVRGSHGKRRQNAFGDSLFVFWHGLTGARSEIQLPCTTLPGTDYLVAPMHRNGTAIICPGVYPQSHRLGRHRGKRALIQQRPLKVWRDDNRDTRPDLHPGVQRTYGDVSGLNIHRASTSRISRFIGSWSAGCIVLANPRHMDMLYSAVQAQSLAGLGKSISLRVIQLAG